VRRNVARNIYMGNPCIQTQFFTSSFELGKKKKVAADSRTLKIPQ
jgi:hypothetical protein